MTKKFEELTENEKMFRVLNNMLPALKQELIMCLENNDSEWAKNTADVINWIGEKLDILKDNKEKSEKHSFIRRILRRFK